MINEISKRNAAHSKQNANFVVKSINIFYSKDTDQQ